MAAFSINFPCIMGIINATPDSFSGDGVYVANDAVECALGKASSMVNCGASILDIGGESTRPGSKSVSSDEELQRVMPIIKALRNSLPYVILSIDTTKPDVAEAALASGVQIINSVSAGDNDEAMVDIALSHQACLVLMHNSVVRDNDKAFPKASDPWQGSNDAADIVSDVIDDLRARTARALDRGLVRQQIIIDPGLGFGKTVQQNLQLIRAIPLLNALGYPVLIGASRKSFIARSIGDLPEHRHSGTAAVTAIATFLGASILRVHDNDMIPVMRMAQSLKG